MYYGFNDLSNMNPSDTNQLGLRHVNNRIPCDSKALDDYLSLWGELKGRNSILDR